MQFANLRALARADQLSQVHIADGGPTVLARLSERHRRFALTIASESPTIPEWEPEPSYTAEEVGWARPWPPQAEDHGLLASVAERLSDFPVTWRDDPTEVKFENADGASAVLRVTTSSAAGVRPSVAFRDCHERGFDTPGAQHRVRSDLWDAEDTAAAIRGFLARADPRI